MTSLQIWLSVVPLVGPLVTIIIYLHGLHREERRARRRLQAPAAEGGAPGAARAEQD